MCVGRGFLGGGRKGVEVFSAFSDEAGIRDARCIDCAYQMAGHREEGEGERDRRNPHRMHGADGNPDGTELIHFLA